MLAATERLLVLVLQYIKEFATKRLLVLVLQYIEGMSSHSAFAFTHVQGMTGPPSPRWAHSLPQK